MYHGVNEIKITFYDSGVIETKKAMNRFKMFLFDSYSAEKKNHFYNKICQYRLAIFMC